MLPLIKLTHKVIKDYYAVDGRLCWVQTMDWYPFSV